MNDNYNPNPNPNQVRQGDVLLVRVGEPLDLSEAKRVAPENGRNILAYGEATGHHHSVDAAVSTVWVVANNPNPVIVVDEPTTINHQEHGAIDIGAGQYWVVRQQEYTPAAPRRVAD